MIAVYVIILRDLIVEEVRKVSCDGIYIVDVVAILRACEREFSQLLVAFPVAIYRIDDVCQCACLVLEYELSDHCQRIGGDRESYACEYRSDVVLRSAVDKIPAVLHAVLIAR